MILVMAVAVRPAMAESDPPGLMAHRVAQLHREHRLIQLVMRRHRIEQLLGRPIPHDALIPLQTIRLAEASLWGRLTAIELDEMSRRRAIESPGVSDEATPQPGPVEGVATGSADVTAGVSATETVTAATAPPPSVDRSAWDRWRDSPLDSLSISGYKNFDFSYAGGSRSTGLIRSESLKLVAVGRSAGTTINVSIDQNSLAGSNENTTQVTIVNDHFKAVFGQFKTDFVGLDLLSYHSQLDGIQGDATIGPHHLGVIYSTAKGGRKKELFYGNNSQGPFVAKYRPIVGGSEQVMINGQVLERDRDYQLDYDSGNLRFLKRVVVPEDQIQWSYDSENTDFKDQLSGLKYWWAQSDSTGVGIVSVQKSAQTDLGVISTYGQRRVIVGHTDQAIGSSNIHAELAVSDTSDDTGGHDSGSAASIRGQSTWESGGWKGYLKSVGPHFQSIDSAGVVSGDITAGGDVSTRWLGIDSVASVDHARQTINGVPMVEQTIKSGARTRWFGFDSTVSVMDSYHSESPVSGNTRSDYRRQLSAASIQVPSALGKFSTQVSLERKESYVSTSDSFQSQEWSGGVSTGDGDRFNGSLEYGVKSIATGRGELSETNAKLSSMLRFSPADVISGFFQYRTRTGDYPVALMSVSTEFKPNPAVSVTQKTDLENLREPAGNTAVDMYKWEVSSRISVEPVSYARCKVSGKLNAKVPKDSKPPSFFNHDVSIESTLLPMPATTLGFQYNLRGQQRGQYRFYPDAVFIESIEDSSTVIGRCLTTIMNVSVMGQYDSELNNKGALVTTADPTLSHTITRTDKLKGDVSAQFGPISLGGGVEAVRIYAIVPSSSVGLQNIYTTFVQWRPAPFLTSKAAWSYIDNFDTESFISTKPELSIDIRFPLLTATIKYSRLVEMRSLSTPITERWDGSMRADLTPNLSLTVAIKNESFTDTKLSNLEANARVMITF